MPQPKRSIRRTLVLNRSTVRRLSIGPRVSAKTECACTHHCAAGWIDQVAQ